MGTATQAVPVVDGRSSRYNNSAGIVDPQERIAYRTALGLDAKAQGEADLSNLSPTDQALRRARQAPDLADAANQQSQANLLAQARKGRRSTFLTGGFDVTAPITTLGGQ